MPIVKSSKGALAKVQEIDWKLEDFGDEPILFGLLPVLQDDPVLIAVAAILSLLWAPWLGGVMAAPTALGLLVVGANDVHHATRKRCTAKREPRVVYQEPIEELPPSPIGTDTRLNAVEVPSAPVSPAPVTPPAPPAVEALPKVAAPDYPPAPPLPSLPPPAPRVVAETVMDVILSSPYQSRAIFGSQRTGKSYLAALASAEMARKGTKVYHLNMASVGTEDDSYWTHTTRSVRCDLTKEAPRSAHAYIQQACDLVQQWWAHENSILIVDEWAHLGGRANGYSLQLEPLLQMIADKISAVSSTGIKRRRAIWTIAPEFVAGDLQQDAKAVKKLALLLLAIPKGKVVDWHGSAITFNEELYDQIARNYPIIPFTGDRHLMGCDRCGFVDGIWMPLGTEGYALPTPAPVAMATVGAPAPVMPAPHRTAAALPTFPDIEGDITQARANDRAIVAEFLEWLMAQGQGTTFTTQAVMNGAWAGRWAPKKKDDPPIPRGLANRSKALIFRFLCHVKKMGYIQPRFSDPDAAAASQTWEVTLR